MLTDGLDPLSTPIRWIHDTNRPKLIAKINLILMFSKQIILLISLAGGLVGAATLALLPWSGPGRLVWMVGYGPESSDLKLPGVVETHVVRLGPRTGGRVAEVSVAEGDLVQAGQILVRLEAPELEAEREQAQSQLMAAEAMLEKARKGPRPQELDAARAVMAAAEAQLRRLEAGARDEEIRSADFEAKAIGADLSRARREMSRIDGLYSRNAVARSQVDSARAELGRLQNQALAAQSRLELLLAGSRPEEIAAAAAERDRVRAELNLLLAGTRREDVIVAEAHVIEARGRLKQADANLQEILVRAPRRVVVETLAVRCGDLVAPNQPIVRTLAGDDIWVKVYVPETELSKVRLGQTVQVSIDDSDRRFRGEVVQVAGQSEFTPRNVQSIDERRFQVFGVRVRVTDPEGILKSGMAAVVAIPLREAH